jgi:hypothetical protein
MRISTTRTTISFALLISMLLPVGALAQKNEATTHDWSNLKTVTSGSRLEIELKSGKTISGKLVNVSDNTLALTAHGKQVDLNRDEILTVFQSSRKSATKATLIGLGVGGGAGALIGAAGGDSNPDPFISKSTAAAGLAVLGAGAGAIAGYFIGRTGRRRVLIYEAR